MPTKVALIVDDSKTAQIRLKRLLEKYDTTVEIAFSAEQALTMLLDISPSIVFMDHTMDGMDGLEALKIIKNNPDTAMIPVVMYTAQSDEVYISQARSLGALDTLSKDVFKPSNIDDLMGRLGIPKKGESFSRSTQGASSSSDPAQTDEHASNESRQAWSSFQLVEALAEAQTPTPTAKNENSHQASVAGTEKLSTVLTGIKRILGVQAYQISNLQEKFEGMSLDHISLDDTPLTVLHDQAQADRARQGRRTNLMILLTLVSIILMAVVLLHFTRRLEALDRSVAQLHDQSAVIKSEPMLPSPDTELGKIDESVEGADLQRFSALFNWLSSVDLHYGYNESPLNAYQVNNIQELVVNLSESGFSGTINLKIHFGNYCLQAEPLNDEWVLAREDMALIECTFYEDVKIDTPAESYLSIPYIQFEESSISILSGEIKVNVKVAGFAQPSLAYPGLNSVASVDEWNRIAARNNRLSIELVYEAE